MVEQTFLYILRSNTTKDESDYLNKTDKNVCSTKYMLVSLLHFNKEMI